MLTKVQKGEARLVWGYKSGHDETAVQREVTLLTYCNRARARPGAGSEENAPSYRDTCTCTKEAKRLRGNIRVSETDTDVCTFPLSPCCI